MMTIVIMCQASLVFALSFYLIILLIPTMTIIAVVTSSLHISVDILEMAIKEFILTGLCRDVD